MKRYLNVIKILIKLNIQKNLYYPLNVPFVLLSSGAYIITNIISQRFIFDSINTVAGYTFKDMYVLVLLGQLIWYYHTVLGRKNFQLIVSDIHQGTFDFLLIKPLRIRWILLFMRFDFRHIPPLIVVSILLMIELVTWDINSLQIFLAIIFFLNGLMIMYSYTFIFITSNLWGIKNKAIFDINVEIAQIIQNPIEVFPSLISFIFTFILPLTVILNPTLKILKNDYSSSLLITALAINFALFFLSSFIWKKGIKNYPSVG